MTPHAEPENELHGLLRHKCLVMNERGCLLALHTNLSMVHNYAPSECLSEGLPKAVHGCTMQLLHHLCF